ncbi:O-methyltransferase [Leptospira borgpetersenii]|uniref:O-methyltransferase n=1 Tax=Leptospira borgpetersenii TaxID=174 RepID=UPI0007745350|nr:methyltransferase [Leptospira borgpetersenii]MBE8364566.1 O-methyltransferase [Leptospira borgpetersenii serovar Balcanica]MBE8367734.1 O-methyltransferase [Leptospira borgpetersenii serovar Balcanica]MBE8399949.1 O-methyltransferase [Leptospira borgpetersenii serovar Tarassovi]MBE8403184.1 O-methyltransferase [Leptospira borgpetersenii serovar Tarassovi]MBE8406290.1 O-methyltransferase [Leptospira borgpetersenii serovar Tarassovi]
MSKGSPPGKYGTSIFLNGLEERIDSELVVRPIDILLQMEEDAAVLGVPVLTPASGAVLRFLVECEQPEEILELGTGYGVSLFWMASGLNRIAKIVSLEREIDYIARVRSYLEKHPFSNLDIHLLKVHCLQYLKEASGNPNVKWSGKFVFVDCDKVLYPEIFRILKQAQPDTAVFDNVLWHGRIFDPSRQAPSDKAVREFWDEVKSSNFPYTLFPVGDGLLRIRFHESFKGDKNSWIL